MDMRSSNFHEMVKDMEAWHVAINGVRNSWTSLSDWAKATTQRDAGSLSHWDISALSNLSISQSDEHYWGNSPFVKFIL